MTLMTADAARMLVISVAAEKKESLAEDINKAITEAAKREQIKCYYFCSKEDRAVVKELLEKASYSFTEQQAEGQLMRFDIFWGV